MDAGGTAILDNVMEHSFREKKNIKEITVLSKKEKYSIISSDLSWDEESGSIVLGIFKCR
ncbi:MAG: hypothetical protein ACLTEE_02525 [Anaerobutyricum hallii]